LSFGFWGVAVPPSATSCPSGGAVLRSGDSLLVTIQIGRHPAKGGDHAIGQPAELLLKIGGSTRGSSWRRGGLLQLSHHLGVLHIRDPYHALVVVLVLLAATLHILIVGEAHLLLLPLYIAVVRHRCVLIDGLDAQLLLVVVLLEVALQPAGQLQLVDPIVAGVGDDGGPGQLLQGEGLSPVEGHRQAGLEEHHAGGVLVVLQQSGHRWRREHTRIMAVEAVIKEGIWIV